jgi:uncharacterized RDD family membrane protein YckC
LNMRSEDISRMSFQNTHRKFFGHKFATVFSRMAGDNSDIEKVPRTMVAYRQVCTSVFAFLGCVLLTAAFLIGQPLRMFAQAAATNADNATNTVPGQVAAEASDADTNAAASKSESDQDAFWRRMDEAREKGGINRNEIVVMGKDVVLKAGESAETVVVIGGSAKIFGNVREQVVAIGGDIEVQGEVGQEVVAVMGSVKVGPTAKLHGDLVSVGGKTDVAEGATVHGRTQEVDFGAMGLPFELDWLKKWFRYCVLRMRPLAPQVGWVWGVAGVFFLIYLLVASVFPRPVQACVDELTRRPATTFLMGLLTKLLAPLLMVILTVTGIGLLVIPFVVAALLLGGIVGKTALIESLGLRIGRQFGASPLQRPVLALVVGAILISIFYMIPVLGLLTFGIISVWGLGGAVTAAFGGLRREIPAKPAPIIPPAVPAPNPPPASTPVGAPAMAMAGGPSGFETTAFIPPSSSFESAPESPSSAATATMPTPEPPGMSEALTYPRSGFWERMGAAFLDVVLVGVLGGMAGGVLRAPPVPFLVALAYFSGMWAWKGTTVGGIVLGLKVVRLDGQPVTFTVSLVRALAAAFSIIVLFLGFLWIAWDNEKQGWHDRIAGTVVIRLPRGTPLV